MDYIVKSKETNLVSPTMDICEADCSSNTGGCIAQCVGLHVCITQTNPCFIKFG